MRPFVIAVAALAFASAAFEAEARGFRFRGGTRTASLRPSAPGVGLAVVPAISFRAGEPMGTERIDRGLVTRSVLSAEALPHEAAVAAPMPGGPAAAEPAQAEPAPVVKVAEPWCRGGRTVGAGSGFCLIN